MVGIIIHTLYLFASCSVREFNKDYDQRNLHEEEENQTLTLMKNHW